MICFSKRAVLFSLTAGAVLLLVLTGVWILRFERQARAPVALAVRNARSSVKIRQLLGEPLRIGRLVKGTIFSNGGGGNADLAIRIHGPLGEGILDEWAQEDSGKWHICSLAFQSSDGSINIPLVDDSSTHCERE
ncbi:MAG: cytochrome c oxidase assembly factor Coa1 family protein [Terracidiphilus sp.]|jgi:hypothetical protein